MNRRRSSCGNFLRLGALGAAVLLAGFGLAACGGGGSRSAGATTIAPTTTRTPFKPPPRPAPPRPKPVASGGGSGPASGTSSRRQEIDNLRRQLYKGNVAFNAPPSLHLNDSAEIELLVGLAKLNAMKAALSGPAAQKQGATALLSNQMQAKLTGIGFDIVPESAETQPVGVVGNMTQWRWQVSPTRTGKLHLHLTLNAMLRNGGETQAVTIRTFDRTIPINVAFDARVSSFFGDNWQWLFTTLLLPIGISVWRVLRRRQGREAAPEGPKAPLQP